MGRSDPTTWSLTWDELPARLATQMRVDIDPETVVAAYRGLYPAYTPTEVYFAATTASRSWRAAIVEAELRADQGSAAYAYQLDWKSPADGGKWGAPHTLDIPLVFDNLAQPGSRTGTSGEARRVAAAMRDALLAFARSGDPRTGATAAWSPYSLPRRETMVFAATPSLQDDPRGGERRLYRRAPFIQRGTVQA
jgi:para-nitrobenzyl esterase